MIRARGVSQLSFNECVAGDKGMVECCMVETSGERQSRRCYEETVEVKANPTIGTCRNSGLGISRRNHSGSEKWSSNREAN